MEGSVTDSILFEVVFEHKSQFFFSIAFIYLEVCFVWIKNLIQALSFGMGMESSSRCRLCFSVCTFSFKLLLFISIYFSRCSVKAALGHEPKEAWWTACVICSSITSCISQRARQSGRRSTTFKDWAQWKGRSRGPYLIFSWYLSWSNLSAAFEKGLGMLVSEFSWGCVMAITFLIFRGYLSITRPL